MSETPGEVTELLTAWQTGDQGALDRLMPIVHDRLKRIAVGRMRRERQEHTLQPTELVNEAYIRLVDQTRVDWRNRAHFFAVAAELMRRILIDHAKQKRRAKRGGGMPTIALDEHVVGSEDPEIDLLDLNDALTRLGALEPRQEQLVTLRFFGGLTIDETAAVLDISPATVKREWAAARAWMYRELQDKLPDPKQPET